MKRWIVLTPLTLLLLTGCVASKQWRTNLGKANIEDRFVIPADAKNKRFYSLAFVEFRNDGQPFDPRQLEAAKKEIDEADARSNHHALVIAFVHGWKNNASQSNNNVIDFRKQINNIAWKYCRRDLEHCGVVGVYLAWSGDSVARDLPTARQLSYFNRRDVAAEVALTKDKGSTKDAVAAKAASSALGQAVREIMKQARGGSGRQTNQTVVVGHSFGGLILEYAIEDQMRQIGKQLQEQAGQLADPPALKEFADLVVLINQAAPADHALELLAEYREELQKVELRWPKPPGCQANDNSGGCMPRVHPLLLSVSSESDLATKGLLPVVETIMPPKDRPRVLSPKATAALPVLGLDVKKIFTTAAAHTSQLYSHELHPLKAEETCATNLKASILLPKYAPGNDTRPPANKPFDYCVQPIQGAWNQTPYWIFHIPPEVVPDHGTIFTDRFTDFLSTFLPPPETLQPTPPVQTVAPPPPEQKLYRK